MSNYLDRISLSGTIYPFVDSSAIHSMDGYWTSADTETAINQATSGKADSSDITPLFGNVAYDSETKHINFYHNSTGGTVLAYVDASDFIKDGMVDNVEIKDVTLSGESVTCLVITFNTDSGKEEIDIPISEIFDASNYYTKSEIDNVVSGINTDISAVSGTVSGMNTTLTSHTSDTTIHVTSSDKTTWSGKQDALVNQVNIKSINGTSILGSGDLQVQSLPTVSGSTLIFS